MKVPALGIDLDVMLNGIACGRHVQTLSKRAAQAQEKGKRWGCVMCGVLGKVFPRDAQGRDHCAQALVDREQGY